MSLNFSWDSVNASTKGFTTHNVDKDVLEQMDRTFLDPPKYPGAIELIKKFPKRIIGCDGRLVGTSYSNLVTSIIPAFSAYLYTTSDVRLIFSDETDRFFNAQFYRFRRVRKHSFFRVMNLEFICADPFSYNTTADDNDETGVTTDGYTWTETNSGHYYAYPTITITFNQVQTHIYISNNTITGCRFDIAKSFVNTDVLVLNSKTLNITLNSSYSPAGFGDGGNSKGQFIILGVGANTLEIGTDDATLDVDVNVNYYKNYLS